MPTAYPELDELLEELIVFGRRIFGDGFVGAYLTGSFAVGDADLDSDCDFLVVIRDPATPGQEAAVRAFHDEVPTREGHWNRHLEGSYGLVDDLGALERMGRPWLFVDHGSREMQWSDHCNGEVTRWSLFHHGVTLAGPAPDTFVARVPPESVTARMRADLPTLTDDILEWANIDHAWTQRYFVTSYCRALYSLVTGTVVSKHAALLWAEEHLDPRWIPLLRQVQDDRVLGLDPIPPRPGSLAAALAFADWCRDWAAGHDRVS